MIYFIFIILSGFGVVDASYLAWKHWRKQPLACPINSDCTQVTESAWSTTLSVRNEAWGLLYYSVCFLLGLSFLFLPQYNQALKFLILIINSLGFIFSIFLVYVQKYRIKTYCFFCLMSALITTCLAIVSLIIFLD